MLTDQSKRLPYCAPSGRLGLRFHLRYAVVIRSLQDFAMTRLAYTVDAQTYHFDGLRALFAKAGPKQSGGCCGQAREGMRRCPVCHRRTCARVLLTAPDIVLAQISNF